MLAWRKLLREEEKEARAARVAHLRGGALEALWRDSAQLHSSSIQCRQKSTSSLMARWKMYVENAAERILSHVGRCLIVRVMIYEI